MILRWDHSGYDLAFAGDVPARSGIYAIARVHRLHGLALSTQVLYVGQALDLRRRFKDHLRIGEQNATLAYLNSAPMGDQLEWWWAAVPAHELDQVERALIRTFEPPANHIRFTSVS